MSIELVVVIRAVAAIFVAMIGAAIAVSAKKLTHRALCALISIAAGALLSVTILEIIPEAYELAGPLWLALGFISGYVLFFLISKYVHHICPACAATHTEERFIAVNLVMISAVALHSMMDGIGVAVSYTAGDEVASLIILLAISFHKFPEGLALASVARGAGYSRGKAFLTALGVEMMTLIGALITLGFLKDISLLWFGVILAHIGGGFVYLTVHAMIGEMVKHERRSILVYAVIGFVIILIVSLGIAAMGI